MIEIGLGFAYDPRLWEISLKEITVGPVGALVLKLGPFQFALRSVMII